MEWLSQNWIWLALGVGAVFMMTRGGGCCGGGGHGTDSKQRESEGLPPKEIRGDGVGHHH